MRLFAKLSIPLVLAVAVASTLAAPPPVSGQEATETATATATETATATATVTPTTTATPTGTIVSGEIPPSGFGLIVFGGGTVTQLVQASGCNQVTLAFWVTIGGSFVTYVPATTVAVVNEAFFTLYPGGVLPPMTAMIAKCT